MQKNDNKPLLRETINKETYPAKTVRKPCDWDGTNAWTAIHIPVQISKQYPEKSERFLLEWYIKQYKNWSRILPTDG